VPHFQAVISSAVFHRNIMEHLLFTSEFCSIAFGQDLSTASLRSQQNFLKRFAVECYGLFALVAKLEEFSMNSS
jgi:hypothetical protein